MTKAIPTVRGCGTRVKGGLYLETGLAAEGSPIEHFLLCPPLLLDLKRLGITPVGIKIIERNGYFHVIDWVGSESYPNVADYIEETRRFGLSRRISKSTDLSKLTDASRILLIHARAYVDNFDQFDAAWIDREEAREGHPVPRCPKGIVAHDQPEPPAMCAGLYWQDVAGGEPVAGAPEPRLVTRKMPSFSYSGYARPEGVVPVYQPAVFASFPISRIVAIHADAKEDTANRKRLRSAHLPTEFENE